MKYEIKDIFTKHTPGPWTAGKFQDTGLNNQISVHPAICTAYGAKEEAEANARLIAAAPEMLAALQEVQIYVDNFGESHLTELVSFAISKATGQQ